MKAGFQVVFLVIVVAAATLYAFYLDVRIGAEKGRFLEWIKTERKADWDALTRTDRLLTIRAVEVLRRGPLADDAEFAMRYRLTRHGKRFAIAMSLAGSGIALLLFGTASLGWEW